MADIKEKNKDNVDGLFFVDSQCIACDVCVEEAPAFFQMNIEEGYAYVYFQPQTQEDKKLCYTALELCPVNCIGTKKGG